MIDAVSSAPKKLRLFVALELPRALRDDLVAIGESLAPRAPPSLRFVKADALHVTLKFLGSVEPSLVPAISEVVTEVAGRHRSIAASAGALTAFPRKARAHVVVVELTDHDGAFATLASDLDAALVALGFEPEKRPLRAHVTIARLRAPTDVRKLCDAPLTVRPTVIETLTLFESRLGKDAAYVPIRSCGLQAPSRVS